MGAVQLTMTVGQIIANYPETREVFIHNGFAIFGDDEVLAQLGAVLRLKTALHSKQINSTVFLALLEDKIAGHRQYQALADSVRENDDGALNLLSLLPCPLKVPMQSELKSFLDYLREEKGLPLNYCIEAFFNNHGNFEDYLQHFQTADELPDVIMTAGYSFFYKEFIDRFVKTGVFAHHANRPVNPRLAAAGLIDPEGHFTVIAANVLVMVVDQERLGNLPMPASWGDLLKPEYEKKVVMRGHDGVFCDVVQLNYYKEYGAAGVAKLGRTVRCGLHPAQMVKDLNSSRPDVPPIHIMPYFFYKTMKERVGLRAVWPAEGALAYPVSVLVKAAKSEKLQELTEYLTGPRIAAICADAYFPAVHPAAAMHFPADAGFKWLGWDYIKHHDMEQLLIEVNDMFMAAHEQGGGQGCS